MTTPAKRAFKSGDELEPGPGHGPCPNHATFRAPPGAAGENLNHRECKARDRSGPGL